MKGLSSKHGSCCCPTCCLRKSPPQERRCGFITSEFSWHQQLAHGCSQGGAHTRLGLKCDGMSLLEPVYAFFPLMTSPHPQERQAGIKRGEGFMWEWGEALQHIPSQVSKSPGSHFWAIVFLSLIMFSFPSRLSSCYFNIRQYLFSKRHFAG